MADGFRELGVGQELLEELDRRGYVRPTAVQRAAIPVLRRGANVVMHAASGAGATAAYGVALAERLHEKGEGEAGIQALVVTPSAERAASVALELGQLGSPAGVSAGVPAAGWQGAPDIAVVPIQRVLGLLQSSTLKLDQLKALVLHDVSSMLALEQGDTVDALMSTVPRDAQRIFITSALTPAIEKLADAHVRKALHVPARPAVRGGMPTIEPAATIEYGVLMGAPARQAVAEAVMQSEQPVIFCRSQRECDQFGEELRLRGLQADVRLYGEAMRAGETAIGAGAPFDAESAASAFARGGTVVLEAAQLTHLRNVTTQANLSLRARAATGLESSALDRFRDSIRRALQEEDVEAQLLVIEPLLDEFSAAEIAAAATALLRKRATLPVEPGPRAATAAPSAAPPAMVKLFLSVGQRDGLTTREIVGTITGEAGISGDQIGRVEIRDTFSIVEVAADAAERVIRAVNGTSLKGRSVRVDYDRKPSTQRRPMPARRTRPPR